jgi:predicted dehydrogenase
VFVATSDHLHRRVVLDAVAAGKDVYCEKPMSHSVADGIEMVAAVKAHKRIFAVGSQRVSNIAYKKAAEIYASGRLGEVNFIESQIDRNSISGAWVYPIPHDASPQTIDWDAFLRDAPKRPFEALRFFRWRLFRDYGTGLGGDLYVHQISGIQAITGINTVASRAYTSGGIFRYKDGRDFPDLMATLFDYPGVTVCIRCNQNNDSSGDATIFYGSKGTLTVSGNTLTMTPQETSPRPEGYALDGWTAAAKQQYLDEWHRDNPAPPAPLGEMERFSAPRDYDDTADHISNFFRAIETREHVVEDEVFGNHAAIACHQANYSYFHHAVATWDAATQTIKG